MDDIFEVVLQGFFSSRFVDTFVKFNDEGHVSVTIRKDLLVVWDLSHIADNL